MNQKAMHTMAALLLAAFTHTLPLPLTAAAADRLPDPGPVLAVPAGNPPTDPGRVPMLAQAETPDPGTKTGKRQTYPFRGKVASIDATARTVTLEGRTSRRVISVNDDTRLTRDGATARLEEIKPGEAVGGTLRKSAEGREIATLIRVGLKPKDKAPAGGGAEDPASPGES